MRKDLQFLGSLSIGKNDPVYFLAATPESVFSRALKYAREKNGKKKWPAMVFMVIEVGGKA